MDDSKDRLIIIGASGHGKVVADIANLNGYKEIIFLDDDENKKKCGCYPILGGTELLPSLEGDVFIAIGNPDIRERLYRQVEGRTIPVLVHPNATVAEDVSIGDGTVIMAGAVVNPGSFIGKGSIINTCSSVDHDCMIGEFVHVAVGAHVCGTVNVHNSTWIGAGATVINNVNINSECLIGAGAVVVKDITEEGTYIGVPAEVKK